MARFLDNPEFINKCRQEKRKIDLKVWIDWFGDGEFEEIESATDEVIKLNLSRELEGDIGQAILDQGTLVLDNSNNDYSPKSVASRFNRPIGEDYEFNLIPNRSVMVDLSVNGSDYVHYYSGIITNIEPNYDNSRVSITIEDEMLGLDNFSAPDKLYIEENAREVIRDLLDPSPIDFDEELVDEFDYQITYNFVQEGSILNALRLIAEMVWAKFYIVEDKLRFINFKELDQSQKEIIEAIKDDQFLNNGYGEIYSSQNLYTTIELDSNPLKYTSEEMQMVWTGSEKQSRVTEEYLGSDIQGGKLQLTSSDGAIEQPTNNVPIAENSLTVSFGDKTYITNFGMTSGIKNVDWDKGIIYFKDTGDFPLPSTNQTVTINYSYFILTIPPRKEDGTPYEKEIIAEFENPSTDIQDIDEYIKFQATDLDYDISYASYGITLNKTRLGGAGSTNTVTKQLSSNASTVQVSGYLTHYEKDYKYSWNRGTDYGYANSRAYLIVNDENMGQIGRHAGGKGGSHFRSSKIPVPAGAKIRIRHTFDGDGEKSNKSQMYNVRVTVGETIIDEVTESIENVRVEQYNYPDNRKTRLTFINDSDTEVSVYSTYQGKDVDNIYLLGRPLKRTNPVHVEKTDEDANQAFSYMGKTLSIQNDLFQSQGRMQETTDFLLDYYSTPRSKINIPIRGLGHIDLMDKVHVQRKEADIDNYFLINTIEEEFTEDGEWNQTLELVQAKSSAWQYDSEGFNTIMSSRDEVTSTPPDRPPSVTNLNLNIVPLDTDEGSYPSIEISYEGNRFTRFYSIYLQRDTGGEWEQLTRIDSESYVVDSIFNKGTYTFKVVAENYDGIQEVFETAPVSSINYIGAEPIQTNDITLTELGRKIQKGTYVPVIEVRVDNYLDEYFDEIEVYIRKEGEEDWILSGKTSDLKYEVLAPELGWYEIKVLPIDKHGNKPEFSSIEALFFEVTGETDLPSKVELESVYWGADYIEFTWKPHPDEDFDEYELRKDEYFGE